MGLPTMIRLGVRAVGSYFHRDWDLETLLDVINHDDQLTPEIRHHLKQMYCTMVGILASFILGFHMRLITGNIGGLVAGVGYSVCIIWFPKLGQLRRQAIIRVCFLMAGAMFGGALAASAGPWFSSSFLDIAAELDFMVNAVIGAFLVLGSLEAAVQFYLVTFSSVLLSDPVAVELVFLHTLILTGDPYLHRFQIHTWILWFVAYVAVYSRTLVQRIRLGDEDYVNHAITLFTDALAICLRMINLVFWGAWSDLEEMLREHVENYFSGLIRRYP